MTSLSVLPIDIVESISTQLEKENACPDDILKLRFLRLPHPRTGLPAIFLPFSNPAINKSNIYEVQAVNPNAGRSWFLSDEVVEDGKLVVITPIDSVFILIPILQAIASKDGEQTNFRTLDDMFEEAASRIVDHRETNSQENESYSSRDIMRLSDLVCIQESANRICEFKEITPDLVVYRFSQKKLVEYLIKKATRLAKSRIAERTQTLMRELAKDGLMDDGKEALLEAGYTKLACNMVSQYVPAEIMKDVTLHFNFSELEAHIESMRVVEDAVMQTAKSVKKDAEDAENKKRKAVTQKSRGVEKLKKANIKGMAKLSSFFQKTAAAPNV